MSKAKIRETTVVYGHRGAPSRRMAASTDVHAFVLEAIPTLADQPFESFIALGLDTKHRVVAWSEIGRGDMTACPVDVPGLFRWALLTGVHALVLVHNHPSGEVDPSPEDVALTRRIFDAGQLLGFPVLDHLIVGDRGYASFLDRGILPRA